MEVFVKVTSASLSNFFKLKSSCKDFRRLVEDDYIFQHVLLKELPNFYVQVKKFSHA